MYVIGAEGGPRKIGVTKDVPARLRDLQVGSPYRLSAVAQFGFAAAKDAKSVERAAHDILAPYRLSGEWFSVADDAAKAAVAAAMTRCGVQVRAVPVPPPECAPVPPESEVPKLRVVSSIRAARDLLGWTQKDLAGAAGICRKTAIDVERGTGNPRLSRIRAVHSVLSREGFRVQREWESPAAQG